VRYPSTAPIVFAGRSLTFAVHPPLTMTSLRNCVASMAALRERRAHQLDVGWRIGAAVVLVGLLSTPWLAGFALRTSARARIELTHVSRDRDRAEETARVREAQAPACSRMGYRSRPRG
jgi:hypothetical protein